MGILKIKESKIKAAAISATAVYLALTVFFFLPFDIPHKITPCVSALFIASLWLCPWQISLALLFSALGDHFGSCGNFLAQMGFFALGHIWFIVYFISRYFKKVEPDRKLTGKAKGYLAMVIFCATVLLCVVFFRIVPLVPPGVLTIGVSIYAILICTMLVSAMLQRSSLFALGAILFVFSDFILAWNRFVSPVEMARLQILIPYFLAQGCLFIGISLCNFAKKKR